MRLREALSAFVETANQQPNLPPETTRAEFFATLELLAAQFPDPELNDLTPDGLRDFLSRWYVEERIASRDSTLLPDAPSLIKSLKIFFSWAESISDTTTNRGCLQVLQELSETLPRALEISAALSVYIAERGGAFTFPEFLTSFEEGGQSAYDVGGAVGDVGSMEGHFRIVEITGGEIAAEEMIQEERVSPILFPAELACLLDTGYIINLELVRTPDGWQIVGGGFAYPPGTEI